MAVSIHVERGILDRVEIDILLCGKRCAARALYLPVVNEKIIKNLITQKKYLTNRSCLFIAFSHSLSINQTLEIIKI